VIVEAVDSNDLVGVLCLPERGEPPRGRVVVLGGSEGGIPGDVAVGVGESAGLACLGLAYFGAGHLPRKLAEIPVEYVVNAARWLLRRDPAANARLGLLGISKGAELALLVASTFPGLARAVVAYAPSSVVFPAISRSRSGLSKSSWTIQGRPVPFVPYRGRPRISVRGIQVAPMYQSALADHDAAQAAAIPVEHISCPVLLVSGDDDQMWPSSMMAEAITTRIRAHGGQVTHLRYPDAGHQLLLPAQGGRVPLLGRLADLGGKPDANRRAARDAWPRVVRFLTDTLA
jgi:dienelactone hydrolase